MEHVAVGRAATGAAAAERGRAGSDGAIGRERIGGSTTAARGGG